MTRESGRAQRRGGRARRRRSSWLPFLVPRGLCSRQRQRNGPRIGHGEPELAFGFTRIGRRGQNSWRAALHPEGAWVVNRNSSASGLTVKEWASLNVVRPGEQYIGLTLTLKASLILGENAVGECASWVLTWLCRPNGAF